MQAEDEDRQHRVRELIAGEQLTAQSTSLLVDWLRRLCSAVTRDLEASGAGVSLMTKTGAAGLTAAADSKSGLVEELQFTAGEGPCLDAYASRQPVLEPDLDNGARRRWPIYAAGAVACGVQAVFAFPLQVGAARFGVLEVYRDRAGSLSAEQLAQALTFAQVAVTTVLDGQQGADPGATPAGLDAVLDRRTDLYQAQGMVMVQLGVDLDAALARLRAYAFAQDRRLGEVAADVVARRLRFRPGDPD